MHAGSRMCKVQGSVCPMRQVDLTGAIEIDQDVTVCSLPEVPVNGLVSLPMPRAAGHTAGFVPMRGVQSCLFIYCLIICVSSRGTAVQNTARLDRLQLVVASKCAQHCHIAGCSELCLWLTGSIIALCQVQSAQPCCQPELPHREQ